MPTLTTGAERDQRTFDRREFGAVPGGGAPPDRAGLGDIEPGSVAGVR